MKKAVGVIVLAFWSMFNHLKAESILFSFVDGSNASHRITDVRNISLNDNALNLNLIDGTVLSWNISTIISYRYGEFVGLGDHSSAADILTVLIYPNPGSGRINISYETRKPEMVDINIFDAQGRLVKQLQKTTLEKGSQHITWDGIDAQGNRISSGNYFCRISTEKYTISKPFVVIQ